MSGKSLARTAALLTSLWLSVATLGCGARLPWHDSIDEVTATGTLEAYETVIAPRVTGAIVSLPQEGAFVASGAPLIRLDDRAVQLGIRQATDTATRLALELQSQDFVLTSPVQGVVTRVPGRVGEMAFPGEALAAVADLSSLRLTVYVPEVDLARVREGQRASLVADPYPDRRFEGIVTSIGQHAEFTPRNVQTRSDRLNLVFAVKLDVPNADRALRPGMAVDASFLTEQVLVP